MCFFCLCARFVDKGIAMKEERRNKHRNVGRSWAMGWTVQPRLDWHYASRSRNSHKERHFKLQKGGGKEVTGELILAMGIELQCPRAVPPLIYDRCSSYSVHDHKACFVRLGDDMRRFHSERLHFENERTRLSRTWEPHNVGGHVYLKAD